MDVAPGKEVQATSEAPNAGEAKKPPCDAHSRHHRRRRCSARRRAFAFLSAATGAAPGAGRSSCAAHFSRDSHYQKHVFLLILRDRRLDGKLTGAVDRKTLGKRERGVRQPFRQPV